MGIRIGQRAARFLAFSAAAIAAAAILSSATAIPAQAQACGRENQRPCTIFERVPSCNRGLVENFATNRCVAQRRAPACGGNNQRPCLVTERVPSCNPGLVEDFGANRCVARARCGAQDQRPCLVTERIPSCNSGLAENFLSNTCVAAGPDHLRRQADQALRDLRPLLNGAIAAAYCQSLVAQIDRLRMLLNSRDVPGLDDLVRRDPCLTRLRQAALSGGYSTFTLGLGGGLQLGIGVNAEIGVAFDAHLRNPPRIFTTTGFSSGWGANVGNDFIVSFYRAHNTRIAGDSQGFLYSGSVLAGGGAAIWYDYQGRLTGASAFVSRALGGNVGVYNRVRTVMVR